MHKSLACVLYFSVVRLRVILNLKNFFLQENDVYHTCHLMYVQWYKKFHRVLGGIANRAEFSHAHLFFYPSIASDL